MHSLSSEELRVGTLSTLIGVPLVEMNEVALEEALVPAVTKVAHVDTLDTSLTEELLEGVPNEGWGGGTMSMGNTEAWEVRDVKSRHV